MAKGLIQHLLADAGQLGPFWEFRWHRGGLFGTLKLKPFCYIAPEAPRRASPTGRGGILGGGTQERVRQPARNANTRSGAALVMNWRPISVGLTSLTAEAS